MIKINHNEELVNNSNQPSQTNKFTEMIDKKISDLTEQMGKISQEISELKTIEISDEVQKIIVGSTEFNIEDFMTEPNIQKYRNWLNVKKELEEKGEDEIDELVMEIQEKDWDNSFQDYILKNYHWSDINDLDDFINWEDFVYDCISDPDDFEIEHMKDDFMNDKDSDEVLNDYIEEIIG